MEPAEDAERVTAVLAELRTFVQESTARTAAESAERHQTLSDNLTEQTDQHRAALDERLERQHEILTGKVDNHLSQITGKLDEIDAHIASAVEPVLRELKQRPDRHEFEETVTEAVENSHDDMTKRLASLEETMLTLAEALLRPGRDGKKRRRRDDE